MKLKFNIYNSIGRNRGRISSYHRESGRKKLYCLVDFWRSFNAIEGEVLSIVSEGYRTGPIALICYLGGFLSYVLKADDVNIGDRIGIYRIDNCDTILKKGSSYKLNSIPVGSKIFNLEFFPGKGGKISRSAGTFSLLIKKYTKTALIKLSSGEYRMFSLDCLCTFGRVGNVAHKNKHLGKAGISRFLGRRPIVRGRAMNPVDHPHGGRTNGGVRPSTPWGKIAKGVKMTRAVSSFIVKRRIK